MKPSKNSFVRVGGRASALSVKQIEEVERHLRSFSSVVCEKRLFTTRGDQDKVTSLRAMEKTDFFSDTLDQALLLQEIDVAVHSAKDLPEPLPAGLEIFALTAGVDPRDAVVLREGESFWTLPTGAIMATSSERREEMMRKLRGDLRFRDARGVIEERLELLKRGEADGVVVALAALIRLELLHLPHMVLEGETAPLQGKLAIVGREGDEEMKKLFRPLDTLAPR